MANTKVFKVFLFYKWIHLRQLIYLSVTKEFYMNLTSEPDMVQELLVVSYNSLVDVIVCLNGLMTGLCKALCGTVKVLENRHISAVYLLFTITL